MSTITRSLRVHRRHLDAVRRDKPAITILFPTPADRDTYVALIDTYVESLTLAKTSFKDVQRQYLEHDWDSDADQKAADTQAEEDGALLVETDKILAEVGSLLRRLNAQIKFDQDQAIARAAPPAVAPVVPAPVPLQAPAPAPVTVQLPKLVFPTFDGNVLEWQSFWDRFALSIHDNTAIATVDKMNYLKGQVTGAAAKVILGLAITEANYPVAINMLKERFGNKDTVIDAHYVALSEIQPASNMKALRATVDQLELHLNSLAALGEDVNHRHFMTIIKSKLPPSVVLQLDKERDDDDWDVAEYREHLRRHILQCDAAYQKAPDQRPTAAPAASDKPKFGFRGKPPLRPTIGMLLAHSTPTRSNPPPPARTAQPPVITRPVQRPMDNAHGRPHNANRPQPRAAIPPPRLCPFCAPGGGHFADECPNVVGLQRRRQCIRDKNLCSNCLNAYHPITQCPRNWPCFYCKKVKRHHASICPDKNSATAPEAAAFAATTDPHPDMDDGPEATLMATHDRSSLQTVTASLEASDGQATVITRGLFDNGSQRSYITDKVAHQLKLPVKATTNLNVLTFGSQPAKRIEAKVSEIRVRLKDGTAFPMIVHVVPTIAGNIRREAIDASLLPALIAFKHTLADSIPTNADQLEINFLIGADYMWELLKMERKQIGRGLHLVNSKLGWLLCGRYAGDTTDADPSLLTASLMSFPLGGSGGKDEAQLPDPQLLWDLETIGIKDPINDNGDEIALRNFHDTITYSDNRYHVTWPWKDKTVRLPTNFGLALGRLNSLLRRYSSEPEVLQQYHQVIIGQFEKGVIEKVDDPSSPYPVHYIPHHPVITPGRSTKLRIVYDGSAKSSSSHKSMNELLYRGPVLLENIVAILLRFRLNRIAMTADVEKAFLQIGLQEAERDVCRFLWIKDPNLPWTDDNLQIYRFCRVPFGVNSSPFLLAATIDYHLRKDGCPVALDILRNMYVDNMITGVDTVDEANDFYRTAKPLFQSASMNLREWMSNASEFIDDVPLDDRATETPKILGLPWDPKQDTLSIPTPPPFDAKSGQITKRSVLKYLASFFDPLGFFCPALLSGKTFLQHLWELKIDWDTPFSSDQRDQWSAIASTFIDLSQVKFPRFIGPGKPSGGSYELHAFCDASQIAYGVSIYIRYNTSTSSTSHLVFAKARLAPLRGALTIPRLELLALHIGCKALEFVANSLQLPISAKHVWTDSKCALHWLHSDKTLTVFVRNRVKAIMAIPGLIFRYVPTEDNPADIASRGMPAARLLQSQQWWTGPPWLQDPTGQTWPTSEFPPDPADVPDNEVMLTALPAPISLEGCGSVINIARYSSLDKLLRVTALCLRMRSKSGQRPSGPLQPAEIGQAKVVWLQYIQRLAFSDVFSALDARKSHPLIKALSLFKDADGVLRCGSRLTHSALPDSAVNPVLLPKSGHFTELVIRHVHQRLFHAGTSHTLSQLRHEYWVPAGRSCVRKFINACHRCKRVDGGPFPAPPVPALPAERVTPSAPFTHVGLDYLGPLFVKKFHLERTESKAWICLFTCLATRAIHLELVDDLTAAQFLQCLRRFFARRGVPRLIISDNAAQFKLVKTALDQKWRSAIEDDAILSYTTQHGIRWRFIPERAPWMGGFYERLVRLVKQALRKSLGRICLTTSQLQTLLCEIEAVINSRPLTFVGSDFPHAQVLTPTHFLTMNPKVGTPAVDPSEFEDEDFIPPSSRETLLATWKKGERHLATFWRIWYNDYLLSLRERTDSALKKPHCTAHVSPAVGDVVQIHHPGPRGTWLLGRIIALVQSADGQCRTAKVKIANGHVLTRSVTHLYPIECSAPPDASSPVLEQPGPTQATPPVNNTTDRPPKRKAAEHARARIRKMAADDDSSVNLAIEKSSRARTPSSSVIFLALLTVFLLVNPGTALATIAPLICDARHAKLAFNIQNQPPCVVRGVDSLGTVHDADIYVFKRNIARYISPAYRCYKVETTFEAWTNFAKLGFDKRSHDRIIPMDSTECRSMITSRRCREGPLHGSDNLAFTENTANPPFTSGNAWDCCRWVSTTTTNCFLETGHVYHTFGEQFESNLANVAHCEYNKEECVLNDHSIVTWNANKRSTCEFIPWAIFDGKIWNGHFLSTDKDIAFTWSEKNPKVKVCNGSLAILTDQGLPVLYTIKETHTIAKPRRPRRTEEPNFPNSRIIDTVAAQLEALELRLEAFFRDSFKDILLATCKRIEELQSIDLILANAAPTLLARKLFNDTRLMARLSGTILAVWPCIPVDTFHPQPMTTTCTEWIPLRFTLKGKTGEGYLDPATYIIYSNSAPADCSGVQETYIQGTDGQVFLYTASNGSIDTLRGTLPVHPLHTGRVPTYGDFSKVIHRPLELWTINEIRAQTSINDIYHAVDQHESILQQLGKSKDTKDDENSAKAILDTIHSYSPVGWIGWIGGRIQWIWIYACCSIITIGVFVKIIPGPVQKAITATAVLPARMVSNLAKLSLGHPTKREEPPVELSFHGPVERTIIADTPL